MLLFECIYIQGGPDKHCDYDTFEYDFVFTEIWKGDIK